YEIRSVDTAGLESGPNPQITLTTPPSGGGAGGAGGSCGDRCMPGTVSLLLPGCAGAAEPGSPRPVDPPLCLPGEAFEDLATPSGAQGDFRIVFFHVDHLGTPRVLTDEAGAVVGEYALFPFGEEVPGPWSTAESTNSHWFTGHERDHAVGADYMLARNFNSASGRFLSSDPSFRNVNLLTPDTLDGYSYANASPLDTVDPDGLASLRCRPLNPVAGLRVGSPDARTLMHTSFFYDDGAGPPNSGFFSAGVGPDDPGQLKYYGAPVLDHLNDTLLRQAELLVRATGKFDAEDYSLLSHNCHDYAGAVLDAYMRLAHGRKLLDDCRDRRDVEACRQLEKSCHLKESPDEVCQQYEEAKRQGTLPAHQFIFQGSVFGAQR
ncbi:MAG TPA: RHS repeat-associated core domain-containing protein, partial [Verrucomicrobiae bacterium]|nr:RHS repeat-associated core domain-containing protein [Verrucomicrobiae bacterium]